MKNFSRKTSRKGLILAGGSGSRQPAPGCARRPLNSRLDCARLQAVFGLALPAWQQGVDRMLAEILAASNP